MCIQGRSYRQNPEHEKEILTTTLTDAITPGVKGDSQMLPALELSAQIMLSANVENPIFKSTLIRMSVACFSSWLFQFEEMLESS